MKACTIGAGGASNFALANDKKVYTWGFNSRGQLGLGSFTNVISPSPIEGFGDHTGIVIVCISMGEDHTIFLSETGNLYGCGLSSSGRLGIVVDDDMDHKTKGFNQQALNIPFLIPNLPLDGDPLTSISCGVRTL